MTPCGILVPRVRFKYEFSSDSVTSTVSRFGFGRERRATMPRSLRFSESASVQDNRAGAGGLCAAEGAVKSNRNAIPA